MNTNKLILLISTVFVLLYSMQSCTYNNATELYPCDSLNVSYKQDIEPIIRNNCYACHGNGNSEVFGNGNNFQAYDSIVGYTPIIVPSITHAPGAIAMPKGRPKLNDCDIAKIKNWINNGAPNN